MEPCTDNLIEEIISKLTEDVSRSCNNDSDETTNLANEKLPDAHEENTQEISIGLTHQEELEIQQLIMFAENECTNDQDKSVSNDESNTSVNLIDSHPISDCEMEVERLLASYRERILKNMKEHKELNRHNNEQIENEMMQIPEEQDSICTYGIKTNTCMEIRMEIVEDELYIDKTENDNVSSSTEETEYVSKRSKVTRYNRTLIYDKSRFKLPMNDRESPFFIDKKLVPVSIYQEGLMLKKWNPTQVVFEICSQCYWSPPEFDELSYTWTEGFLCSVSVRGRDFVSPERGKTKKLARHLASTNFLRFIGFKFNFDYNHSFVKFFPPKKERLEDDYEMSKDQCKLEFSDLRHALQRNETQSLRRTYRESSRSLAREDKSWIKSECVQDNSFYEESTFHKSDTSQRRTNVYQNDRSYLSSHEKNPRIRLRMDQVSRSSGNRSSSKSNEIYLPRSSNSSCQRMDKSNHIQRSYRSEHTRSKHQSSTSARSLERCIFDKNGMPKLPPNVIRAWVDAYNDSKQSK